MSDIRLPRSIFFVILFAGFVLCLNDFSQLPERLASHFGASGIPNGYMSKQVFLLIYLMVVLIATSVEFLVPISIAKSPDGKINLPNKAYWLAPERRASTFAYFEKFFAWYGCAFLFLEVSAMELAIHANFRNPPLLPTAPIVTLIVSFIVFNIASIVLVFRRFSRTT